VGLSCAEVSTLPAGAAELSLPCGGVCRAWATGGRAAGSPGGDGVSDSSRSMALAGLAFSAWLILNRERHAGEAGEGSGTSAAPDASLQRWCLPEALSALSSTDSNQDQAVAGAAAASGAGPGAGKPGMSIGWCLPG
jgi:hypothetical protein